jgi:YbbR domain-containing protein
VTTRQGQITTVTAPVRLHGIPENVVLLHTLPEEITVQVKAMSSLAPPPSKLELTADIDASRLTEGVTPVRVNHSDISAPSGVSVISMSPATVRVSIEKKLRKRVPVFVNLKGKLPTGQVSSRVSCEPSSVFVEGPASQVARISAVATEEIDASQLQRGKEYLKNLRLPEKQVVVLYESPVTIKLSARGKP